LRGGSAAETKGLHRERRRWLHCTDPFLIRPHNAAVQRPRDDV
jgi:hypothetical protein